jgi:GNAT superfamily N-acetyltransferase
MSHITAPRPILPPRPFTTNITPVGSSSTVQPRALAAAIPAPARIAAVPPAQPAAIQLKPAVPRPILPKTAIMPVKPALATQPKTILPRVSPGHVPHTPVTAHATTLPQPAPAVQRFAPVNVSTPIKSGDGRYRIEASAQGRPVGSLTVHLRNQGAVEVTDLKVDHDARGQGIGKALLGSAARAGLQFGRGRVALASQDDGSGKLTGWYKGMGFRQVGTNQYGYPTLEAPISRVLSGLD